MTRLLLALALTASASFVNAHAHLAASSPAADGLVPAAEAPSVITLEFTEGIELGFSLFKLVRVQNQLDVEDGTYAMRLNALAAEVVTRAFAGRGAVEDEVPFQLQPASGAVTAFELQLDQPLAPGSYALMWRALSVDTHVTEEFITFTVLP